MRFIEELLLQIPGWLIQFLIFAVAAIAAGLAWRSNKIAAGAKAKAERANLLASEANQLSDEANSLSLEANRLADRSIRASKLPTVREMHRDLHEILPAFRSPEDRTAIMRLIDLKKDARLVSPDILSPALNSLYSNAFRLCRETEREQLSSCGSEVGVSCPERRRVVAFLPVKEAVESGSQAARDLSVAPLVVEGARRRKDCYSCRTGAGPSYRITMAS